MAEKTYGYSAFAYSMNAQHTYIVFDLTEAGQDAKWGRGGAQRHLLHTASHELLHALGFKHPRQDGQGEKTNTRGWEQIKQDIAPGLNSATALGYWDEKRGKRVIVYSLNADPSRVPHGNPANNEAFSKDPNNLVVEGMRALGGNHGESRNATHQHIHAALKEAFALHENLFNITYLEAADPNNAHIAIFTGFIPPVKTRSYEMSRGFTNPYNHDVTVMSYNASPGVWKTMGVGDVYVGQQIYGKPAKDGKRHIIDAQRMAQSSGVLWAREPLAIRLAQSPMLGALTVDMGAHPFHPAIEGALKDGTLEMKVRQNLAPFVTIREFDAGGSGIRLNITGADGAVINVGNGSTVRLSGCNNQVNLGPGTDEVIIGHGYGHVVSSLSAQDCLTTPAPATASLERWDAPEPGTLLTILQKETPAASVFLRDAAPEDVEAVLKNITLRQRPAPPALALNAVDMDKDMENAPPKAVFTSPRDIAVSASAAAWHSVHNAGAGGVVVRMSRPQYESRHIAWDAQGQHYVLTFRDGGKNGKIHLNSSARLAVLGPEGQVEKIIPLPESQKEAQLALALSKGTQLSVGEAAALPRNAHPPVAQRR